jgi:hypothetical protein
MYKDIHINNIRMPSSREIVYPIFLECCQYTPDNFWENIFEDLAYGKPPYGTFISKNFLCCTYKKQEFSYKIEKKKPKILYNEVYSLLRNKLGLLSKEEKLKRSRDFSIMEKGLKDSRIKNWSEIRRKNIKDLIIELYVSRMKTDHCLTIKQARYLLSLIYVSLIFKVILAKDINYSDGRIESINGITFSKNTINVVKNIYKFETTCIPDTIEDKKTLAETWPRYISELNKMKNF